MRYQIVTSTGTQTFETTDPIAAFELRGYDFHSINHNAAQRAELQGQPRFKTLNGPMWGGDRDGATIRYEGAGA